MGWSPEGGLHRPASALVSSALLLLLEQPGREASLWPASELELALALALGLPGVCGPWKIEAPAELGHLGHSCWCLRNRLLKGRE